MRFLDSVAVPWGASISLAYGADMALAADNDVLGIGLIIMACGCFMQPLFAFIFKNA